jgi:hypothetical protein
MCDDSYEESDICHTMKRDKIVSPVPSFVFVVRDGGDNREYDDFHQKKNRMRTSILMPTIKYRLVVPSIVPISLALLLFGLLIAFYCTIESMKHKMIATIPELESIKYLRTSFHSKSGNIIPLTMRNEHPGYVTHTRNTIDESFQG